MSCKKGVLKDFAKFTEKHLFQSLFLNNLLAKGTLPINLSQKTTQIKVESFLMQIFDLRKTSEIVSVI